MGPPSCAWFPSLLLAAVPVVGDLATVLPWPVGTLWFPPAEVLNPVRRGRVPFTDGSLSWGEPGCCGPPTPVDGHRLPSTPHLACQCQRLGQSPQEWLCDLGVGDRAGPLSRLCLYFLLSPASFSPPLIPHCWDFHVFSMKLLSVLPIGFHSLPVVSVSRCR